MRSASRRTSPSVTPPGGYGTTMLTGRAGKSCAAASPTHAPVKIRARINQFISWPLLDRSLPFTPFVPANAGTQSALLALCVRDPEPPAGKLRQQHQQKQQNDQHHAERRKLHILPILP